MDGLLNNEEHVKLLATKILGKRPSDNWYKVGLETQEVVKFEPKMRQPALDLRLIVSSRCAS